MQFDSNKMHSVELREIKSLPKGDRVCVDMMSNFEEGHGLLVGSYNRALFLIAAETIDNTFVSTRPARVNAGPVSMYVLCADNTTKYLNELKPGDELKTVDHEGNCSQNAVLRVKIEPRPMLFLGGIHMLAGEDVFHLLDENDNYFNGYRSIFHLKKRGTEEPIQVLDIEKYRENQNEVYAELQVDTMVQDAETIPLVSASGELKSVKELMPGDKIMAYIQNPRLESRHFGFSYQGFCLER